MKRKEAKANLKVCTFNDADFLKHLEICVNLGFSYLFENVDEYIDPIIDPVLEKNLVKKGNSRTVKIGDKDVEWDDGFKLYLTSKIANPHYGMLPDCAALLRSCCSVPAIYSPRPLRSVCSTQVPKSLARS